MAGRGLQRGDTAYIFLERIRFTGGSGLGFELVDSQYVARVHVPTMTPAGFVRLGPKSGILFSKGCVTDGGYTYVFGIRDNGFGNDLFVARYPEAALYAAWEYYNGSGWKTAVGAAASIHQEFTSSFHVTKVARKWLLLTTEFSIDCDQGDEIFSHTASAPTGPFSNKKTVWTVADTLQGHKPVFYLAYAHPEYDNGARELLLTYCVNGYGSCVDVCVNGRRNPDTYRPRAVRVPYAVMGL